MLYGGVMFTRVRWSNGYRGEEALVRLDFGSRRALRAAAVVEGGVGDTTGMVTMLLVKTFCAMYICVSGFVGSVLFTCNTTA